MTPAGFILLTSVCLGIQVDFVVFYFSQMGLESDSLAGLCAAGGVVRLSTNAKYTAAQYFEYKVEENKVRG